jgi:hypothetical protein
MRAAELGKTSQSLLAEALDGVFVKYCKPAFAKATRSGPGAHTFLWGYSRMMSDAAVHQAAVRAVNGFGLRHILQPTKVGTFGADKRYLFRCDHLNAGGASFECPITITDDSTPETVEEFVRDKFAAFLKHDHA